MVQQLGEGSTILTDPQHTPIIIQPSSSQPRKIQKPRKPIRNDAHVPQPSGPTESVADEAVHKELGSRLVRAATTASSLEAKQDSGGGPRCQETIWDTIAQTRVESSGDEKCLGEDASKQERRINAIDEDEDITLVSAVDNEMFDVDMINAIDADEDITLVSAADNEMLDVGVLGGEEVFVAGQNENVVEEVVDAAQVSTAATTVTITTKEITLAQALEALKTSKPKDKGKGIMIEELVKPKKKDQIRLDEEASLKLQVAFDEEERLAREKAEKEERANIALIEE
nr:hypothetical protein [Tanacetum cinerariifolium]